MLSDFSGSPVAGNFYAAGCTVYFLIRLQRAYRPHRCRSGSRAARELFGVTGEPALRGDQQGAVFADRPLLHSVGVIDVAEIDHGVAGAQSWRGLGAQEAAHCPLVAAMRARQSLTVSRSTPASERLSVRISGGL